VIWDEDQDFPYLEAAADRDFKRLQRGEVLCWELPGQVPCNQSVQRTRESRPQCLNVTTRVEAEDCCWYTSVCSASPPRWQRTGRSSAAYGQGIAGPATAREPKLAVTETPLGARAKDSAVVNEITASIVRAGPREPIVLRDPADA
jgi:hypothetical protein